MKNLFMKMFDLLRFVPLLDKEVRTVEKSTVTRRVDGGINGLQYHLVSVDGNLIELSVMRENVELLNFVRDDDAELELSNLAALLVDACNQL